MSDGDKKPGIRDIRSLREKLGMLQKGGGAPRDRATESGHNPFSQPLEGAQQQDPRADLVDNPDALVGNDTAVSRISDPAVDDMSDPTEADETGSISDVRPSAPSGPSGRSGFDVFQSDPAEEPAASAPQGRSSFANPLQMGEYNEAATSVSLSAEHEAELSSYEHKQKGIKPSFAMGLTLGVSLLTLVFGFFIGDVRNARRMINAQIASSVRVQSNMEVLLETYDQLKPVVNSLRKGQLDFDKISKFPKDLPKVDAGGILNSPVPLNPDLSRHLANFIGDLNELFAQANHHRMVTLGRDKAELEGLMSGNDFTRYQTFAIAYTPNKVRRNQAYIPPKGRLIALTGKAEAGAKKGEYVMPSIDRRGREAKVDPRNLIIVDKSAFLPGGKANAMTQYEQRTTRLQTQLKKMEQYEDLFRDTLKKQAARDKVFEI